MQDASIAGTTSFFFVSILKIPFLKIFFEEEQKKKKSIAGLSGYGGSFFTIRPFHIRRKKKKTSSVKSACLLSAAAAASEE